MPRGGCDPRRGIFLASACACSFLAERWLQLQPASRVKTAWAAGGVCACIVNVVNHARYLFRVAGRCSELQVGVCLVAASWSSVCMQTWQCLQILLWSRPQRQPHIWSQIACACSNGGSARVVFANSAAVATTAAALCVYVCMQQWRLREICGFASVANSAVVATTAAAV